MEYIDSELFGEIASPNKFSDILQLTSDHSGDRRNVYMWRGQANMDWPMHSAAYRRLKSEGAHVTELRMRLYERRLIRLAAHQGYDYENGRKLSDLEVLAKLQHHGAATRLMDFSRNLLVALWFACKSEPNNTGLLFGIHTDNIGGYEGELETGTYDEIICQEELKEYSYPQTWQPPVVTKRIASQSAQFVYSAISNDPAGSLTFNKDDSTYLAMAINPSFKKELIELLEGTFDIRQLTLFPDIDGFCFAHNERFGAFDNDRW